MPTNRRAPTNHQIKFMWKAYVFLAAFLCHAASAGTGRTLPGRMRHAKAPNPASDVQFIDATPVDFEVVDVEDEEEEGNEATAILCLAPPCGLKMPATDMASAPLPWSAGLPAPDA